MSIRRRVVKSVEECDFVEDDKFTFVIDPDSGYLYYSILILPFASRLSHFSFRNLQRLGNSTAIIMDNNAKERKR